MSTGRKCFGAYENGEECASCLLAILCIDATIAADGYFDELARREEELWAEQDQLTDARIQAAMDRQ